MTAEFFGMKVILRADMTEHVLHARSPSRAKRRMKRGFRQHYVTRPMQKVYRIGADTLVMHPLMLDAIRKDMRRDR
jgi:hypothetical protein